MMSKPRTYRVSTPMHHATTVVALLVLYFVLGVAGNVSDEALSLTPARGWNSYDSFSWIISEEEFLQNAEYVAENLLEHGYEYVVVDFLWYRKHEPGASVWSSGHDIIDEWGRPMPDPARWPSTKGGKGFKPIADKVHAMGLKFGIHVMRGINTAAVDNDTPILCDEDCPEGRNWTAKEIIVPGGQCSWMWDCFTSVNTSTAGGVAFINSLYQQYAEWEVDMIKHDCVFGVDDLNVPEVTTVSKAIARTGRPILYSLSPGVSATPDMGKQVAHLSHMYRVTSDDWDSWSDVLTHFPVARDFAAAGLIGAPGLSGGKSWPDMDMLPIGWLTDPGAPYGPWRSTALTKDEQMTQVTLWAIAKSPVMFGGDLRSMDQWTLDLITQPTVLEMNAHSTHNRELSSSVQSSLPEITLQDCGTAKPFEWKLKNRGNGQDELCWNRNSKPRYTKGRREAPLTDCLSLRDTPPSVPDLSKSGMKIVTHAPWFMDNTIESLFMFRSVFGTRISPSWKHHGIKRVQLRSSTTEVMCLDSNVISSNKTDRKTMFSRCDGRASQVWQLIDGKLVNHEDEFCAAVREPSNQWKVWVARGSAGQSYVAFFNLGSDRTEISVPVEDILNHATAKGSVHQSSATLSEFSPPSDKIMSRFRRELYRNGGSRWSCAGIDVWNNTHFIANITELQASVESHGTVLYELRCTPGKMTQFYAGLLFYLIVLCVLMTGLWAYHSFAAKGERFNYEPLSGNENKTGLEEAQEEIAGRPANNQN